MSEDNIVALKKPESTEGILTEINFIEYLTEVVKMLQQVNPLLQD